MAWKHFCKGRFWFTIVTVLMLIWCATAITGPSHGKLVVCYISTWAVYRPGRGAYGINNFDPNLCTHVVYAFAGLDIIQSAIKSLDPWQDLKEEYGKGGYERFTSLKYTYPHLKISLAIGGWNEGSRNYSILVSDSSQREQFVKHVANFVRKYNFDGLDLDWEYPTQRGGNSRDRKNFVLLTKELREEFDNYGLMLTSAIGAAQHIIVEAYDIPEISKYLDFLHIMCYDYHGSYDKRVGYNSPLTAPQGDVMSVQYTIDYLLKLGAPPAKVVVGLPFYGRTFKTFYAGNIGDESDSTGFHGPFTREDGFLGYNEICLMLKNISSGWTRQWDPKTSQMLARSERHASEGLVRVVTYDNMRSIANKVKFAILQNLAGIMVWSVDTDDFLGDCTIDEDTYADYQHLRNVQLPKRTTLKYPLLRTVNEAIPLAMYEIKFERSQSSNIRVQDNEIPHQNTVTDHANSSDDSTRLHTVLNSVVIVTISLLIFQVC